MVQSGVHGLLNTISFIHMTFMSEKKRASGDKSGNFRVATIFPLASGLGPGTGD